MTASGPPSNPPSGSPPGPPPGHRFRARLRLKVGPLLVLGPGRRELLKLIAEHGSISAAAREMDMSYRRAWLLVDAVNQCFAQPLVESVTGGRRGGGARLTATGEQVVALFEALETKIRDAGAEEITALESLLATVLPEAKPKADGPS